MERQHVLAAALLGVGAALFGAAYLVYARQREGLADRPPATGDVGFIAVFAQASGGPIRLYPNRQRQLLRPQSIAFQWFVEGTGPRNLRIEALTAEGRTVLHQEILNAPAKDHALDYVLRLDDRAPDRLSLLVVLEAPHTIGYESRYEIELAGASAPFLGGARTATAEP